MKPLRILLGNNTLALLAGSETWVYTLALKLKEMGHYVACYSEYLGIISEKLEEAGIRCFDRLSGNGATPFSFVLEENTNHDYDVIIANHNHVVEFLRSRFPTKPIISTIHGVIHFDTDGSIAPEHPALTSGVNQFVSVSEEVQDKLKKDYGLDSLVIRNGFDVKKFNTLKPAQSSPKQFLVNTNYADKDDAIIKNIREAARMMGARVIAIGQNFAQSFDITRQIELSDVVFGMGRSVLEGVAAGRLGIVYGRWGMGGPVIESNIDALRRKNFSGRNADPSANCSADDIVSMINKHYSVQNLEWGKQYIARDHNVAFTAEQYVKIARELTGQSISRPVVLNNQNEGVDPLARKIKFI